MTLITYLILDSNRQPSGKLTCRPADLQASLGPGQVARVASQEDIDAHDAKIKVMIDAARAFHVPDNTLEVVTEILQAKGFSVSTAEIKAAEDKIRQRRAQKSPDAS